MDKMKIKTGQLVHKHLHGVLKVRTPPWHFSATEQVGTAFVKQCGEGGAAKITQPLFVFQAIPTTT